MFIADSGIEFWDCRKALVPQQRGKGYVRAWCRCCCSWAYVQADIGLENVVFVHVYAREGWTSSLGGGRGQGLERAARRERANMHALTWSRQSQSRYWTKEEHDLFLEGMQRFGPKDMKGRSLARSCSPDLTAAEAADSSAEARPRKRCDAGIPGPTQRCHALHSLPHANCPARWSRGPNEP